MSYHDNSDPTKPKCSMIADPTCRESNGFYAKVVVQASDRWRLILCARGLQWIIQKKERSHAGPWRGSKYVTSRCALIKACGRLGLLSDPATEAALLALPEHVSQLEKITHGARPWADSSIIITYLNDSAKRLTSQAKERSCLGQT